MPKTEVSLNALANELAVLRHSNIAILREKWRVLFRAEPPAAFGPDLLRRSIAQRLQENAFGRLGRRTERDLARIVALLAKSPTERFELPRRIKPGAVLVRLWKGTTHRVTVAKSGFTYRDCTYTSLSEIARKITGTRWNGPRFFGLRGANDSTDGADTRLEYRNQINGANQEGPVA